MSITPAIVDKHEHRELLDATIPSFLKQLESAGYAKKTCRDKRAVLRTFADWLPHEPITVHEVNESHVAAFLKRTPRPLRSRSVPWPTRPRGAFPPLASGRRTPC